MNDQHRLSTQEIERAKGADLIALVGSRIKLTRRGRLFWGLCPFHPDRNPSFKVEREFYKCFACGARGDPIKWLQQTEGLSFPDAVRKLAGDDVHAQARPSAPPPSDPPTDERQAKDDARRTRDAVAIFDQAVELQNSPAWRYLESRGVADGLPGEPYTAMALRWHPRCPWGPGATTHGCMVGLFTDALTGEPRAIHRTAITPQGVKIGRMALGPMKGCVIRLWPVATHRLVTGEGIESCLGAAARFHYFAEANVARIVRPEDYFPAVPPGEVLRPCWAAGCTANLAALPVLPEIPKLIIVVDHDENQSGQKAALQCARRWHEAGREVVRLLPNDTGVDFADTGKAIS